MSNRLRLVIALLTCALLGLLAIQFYWIDNAIELKKEEFNQKVVMAMQHVVFDMERRDMVQNLSRHHMGRHLINPYQLARHTNTGKGPNRFFSGSPPFAYTRIESVGEDGKITITESRNGDSTSKVVTKENGGNESTSTFQIDVSINQFNPVNPFVKSVRSMDSSFLAERMRYRSAFINDILFDMMQTESFPDIRDRINVQLLDSLMRAELDELMISTEMHLGISDLFGNVLAYSPKACKVSGMRATTFRTRLFPNDIFSDSYYLNVFFPDQKSYLLSSMWTTLSVSGIFILLIAGTFAYTISVIQRQKKLSVIKNDFISNMTHELKTPISTISLACEALADEDVSKDNERKVRFLQMIGQENKRLSTLVDNVLKSSIWEKTGFTLKKEVVNFGEIISEVAETTKMMAEKEGGRMDVDLSAKNCIVAGDKVHLTNIVSNLAENALKYSPGSPDIVFRTYDDGKMIYLEVKDKGIGIAREHHKKIFEKFYRVPTGNIHNVKGFGLGLNYVRNIVLGHGGEISVNSSPGKGSCFTINLPLLNEHS